MSDVWRYYQHPITESLARVHSNDPGKAKVYERWGWREIWNRPVKKLNDPS